MNTLRNELKRDYSQIPNELIIDMSISHGALRVLLYLFTKPDNWNVYNKDIQKQLNISDKTLAKYWKELLASKWLRRTKRPPSDKNLAGGYEYHIGSFAISEESSEKEKSSKKEKSSDHSNNKLIKKKVTNKEKIYNKEFSFSLGKETQYENLSQEYKTKLKAKCLLTDGNFGRYEDFITQLQAKGYKYKNFVMAYIAWDKEKAYKSFSPTPEPMLGDDWFKIPISHSEVIAINSKTLETKTGQVETSINNNEPVNEVPISAKTQDFLSAKGLV